MDRDSWQSAVHRVAESDTTEMVEQQARSIELRREVHKVFAYSDSKGGKSRRNRLFSAKAT